MNADGIARTRRAYDRIAPVYDLLEGAVERAFFRPWRRRLWRLVEGTCVLEVGVGTGKNLAYYPPGMAVTGIDISEGMMARAKDRLRASGGQVELCLMDGQRMGFRDDAFHGAVATFVFCSVPDPVLGLRELGRTVRSGGKIILLEHVRINVPVVGALMDLVDPIVARAMGPHVNRRTVANVREAGLTIERVEPLAVGGLVKLIVARSP